MQKDLQANWQNYTMTSFSVLMSVYSGDDAGQLRSALESITFRQTRKPSEIILVVDGPIGDELKRVIHNFDFPINSVWLDENCGLGKALSIGLDHCKHNLVARMDSDDISVPERFEVQLYKFYNDPDLDVLGGQILEFSGDVKNVLGRRIVPLSNQKIQKRSVYRNPMNHMTVMFKKDKVLSVGGYQDMRLYEDYYLWLRLISKNIKLENVKETLVFARAGNELLARRKGLKNAVNEWKFYRRITDDRLMSPLFSMPLGLTRSLLRLVPSFMFTGLYSTFLRQKK